MKILVSACLMGENCRYKGDNCKNDKVLALANGNELIPVCPEQIGGLSTPRNPSERVGDKIISSQGVDVTKEYDLGSDMTVKIAKENNVDICIMKSQSPSCGNGLIYDGTFTGNKIPGYGITTEKLIKAGFAVITENDL